MQRDNRIYNIQVVEDWHTGRYEIMKSYKFNRPLTQPEVSALLSLLASTQNARLLRDEHERVIGCLASEADVAAFCAAYSASGLTATEQTPGGNRPAD